MTRPYHWIAAALLFSLETQAPAPSSPVVLPLTALPSYVLSAELLRPAIGSHSNDHPGNNAYTRLCQPGSRCIRL